MLLEEANGPRCAKSSTGIEHTSPNLAKPGTDTAESKQLGVRGGKNGPGCAVTAADVELSECAGPCEDEERSRLAGKAEGLGPKWPELRESDEGSRWPSSTAGEEPRRLEPEVNGKKPRQLRPCSGGGDPSLEACGAGMVRPIQLKLRSNELAPKVARSSAGRVKHGPNLEISRRSAGAPSQIEFRSGKGAPVCAASRTSRGESKREHALGSGKKPG